MLFSIEQSILAEETLANLWSSAKFAKVSLHMVYACHPGPIPVIIDPAGS